MTKPLEYELTAEGKHGWEKAFLARVKESDLAGKIARLTARRDVLRVVVRPGIVQTTR